MDNYSAMVGKYYRHIPPVSQGEDLVELKSNGLKLVGSDQNEMQQIGIGFSGIGSTDIVPWEDIEKIDVYQDHFTITFYGKLDEDGNVISEEYTKTCYFDIDDEYAIIFWVNARNLLQMWARQSGLLTVIPGRNTPIYSKEIPKVFIHCRIKMGAKNISPDYKIKAGDGMSLPIITPAFEYYSDLSDSIKDFIKNKEIQANVEKTTSLRKIGR